MSFFLVTLFLPLLLGCSAEIVLTVIIPPVDLRSIPKFRLVQGSQFTRNKEFAFFKIQCLNFTTIPSI